MLELDLSAEIAALKSTFAEIQAVVDVPALTDEIARLSEQACAPDLWDDPEQAQKVTSALSHRQSELARELSLTSSAATALVDRLERHGVAERVRHPSDRRRTIIRLTSRGELLADRVHQPLYASLGRVDAADLPTVSRWMGVIADGLLGVRAGLA